MARTSQQRMLPRRLSSPAGRARVRPARASDTLSAQSDTSVHSSPWRERAPGRVNRTRVSGRDRRDERERDGDEDGSSEVEAGTEPLRALFERRYLAMVRTAQLLLGDRASAEDVAQEAFARLHGRIERVAEPDAYLRAVVVNLSRSALRRRKVAFRYERCASG